MRMATKDLVKMAIYLSLFAVLDLASNSFRLFAMPQGGSLGLGVIALLVASYDIGFKKGLMVGLMSVIMQYITLRPPTFIGFGQFLLDYILAFGIYGLACLFPSLYKDKAYPIMPGILITNVLRLFFHTLGGVLYWQTPWKASFTYNASYMIPTLLLCLVLVPLIYKRLPR